MTTDRRTLIALVILCISFVSIQSVAQNSNQCTVRVVANGPVVSTNEWFDVGHHVLPAGVVQNPDAWPFFAWSDTSLGVVRSLDGSGYLFFGSDGGCHENCNSADQRWGSVTVSHGTLDHPLGLPLGDPNPVPYEFTFPITTNIPAVIDYAGGGPVYRVPNGEPGAGSLLLVYHTEQPATPFWSRTGIAKSVDEGVTWQDLGNILTVPTPFNSQGASDVGENPLVPYTDAITQQKYFYIFFPQHCWIGNNTCADFTYISVARAPYEEVLAAAYTGSSVSNLFLKYYDGQWSEPGLGGRASETFPGVTGETDGDFQITWSLYRQRFVAIVDNAQYVAYGESIDGTYWPPMQIILGTNPQTPVYAYANSVGLGDDPGVLGSTFYSYYTIFPNGQSWNPAELARMAITTAGTLTILVPSSATAGARDLRLTVRGDHFVEGSTLVWNGQPVATKYDSANQLTAQIPASDLSEAGTALVAVSNPGSCGGLSNEQIFSIEAAASK